MGGPKDSAARQERKNSIRRMLEECGNVRELLTDFIEAVEEAEWLNPITREGALRQLYPLIGRRPEDREAAPGEKEVIEPDGKITGQSDADCPTSQLTVEGKTILFDDRARQNAALFVGICQDEHPEKPFLAISLRSSRRFKSPRGACRRYAEETGLSFQRLMEAIAEGDRRKGTIENKAESRSARRQ